MTSSPQRIALATTEPYGLTDDDALLAAELERRGHQGLSVNWDADVDWRGFDCVVVRSTWDYHRRHGEFLEWIDALAVSGVRVSNSPELIRWNADKRYLADLARAGVVTVPTEFVQCGSDMSLALLTRKNAWSELVIKPAISASATSTFRGTAQELEGQFSMLQSERDLLVQPFIAQVIEQGEWSLLFYGGEFSHAVIKRPKANDFRVQREHGGSSRSAEATQTLVSDATFALRVAERLHGKSAYARVDGCEVGGRFVLMELELIEPDLFLRDSASAAGLLANALAVIPSDVEESAPS